MAYRGRGRGSGFRGGRGGYAKQEPFVCFPDAELPDIKSVTVEENLVRRSLRLHDYWKASPYYLEDTISKRRSTEIERFSDRNKVGTTIRRDSLSQILEHRSFPAELTEGSKGWQRQPSRKRVRWNPDSEMQKLDIFEKLEQRQEKVQNDKGEKEKKEGENEDEDEDQENEESEEEPSDDDDYNQNVDFDDDENDLNMDDEGEGGNGAGAKCRKQHTKPKKKLQF